LLNILIESILCLISYLQITSIYRALFLKTARLSQINAHFTYNSVPYTNGNKRLRSSR